MLEGGERRSQGELKELVKEASVALARLDTARLEELALTCEAFNGALKPAAKEERKQWARQAWEAKADLAVFARVLDATRANLQVMNRLRELRAVRLEYSEQQARSGMAAEVGHGDN